MSDTATKLMHGSYLMPSLRHATVADAAHPGIVSCGAEITLTEVARLMATHHVHCVAVMMSRGDDRAGESVWGLISDLDLVRCGIRVGAEESAGALALEPVITVKPSMPLREAGELMLQHGVSHVIVVDADSQTPTGVLSTLDIVGVLGWGEA
jgi:predicted transcriptional regulator